MNVMLEKLTELQAEMLRLAAAEEWQDLSAMAIHRHSLFLALRDRATGYFPPEIADTLQRLDNDLHAGLEPHLRRGKVALHNGKRNLQGCRYYQQNTYLL